MISISQSTYQAFCKEYELGLHHGKRFGQAFHDYFKGSKVVDKESRKFLDTLYEANDKSAKKMIASIIDHTN